MLWAPSAAEIDDYSWQNESGTYSYFKKYATTWASRQKHLAKSESYTAYNLRSIKQAPNYWFYVSNTGKIDNYSSLYAICLGFCLGLEPETIEDDWATILANENYATDYAIGDTKMIDLGTEGKHLMEIVAFDEDDRADGQGKAGITWISKDCLNNKHRMNSSSSTSGGWEMCEMRTFIRETVKSLIPETVRNGIVEVVKISTGSANTVDSVWIPSVYELYGTSTARDLNNTNRNLEASGSKYNLKFTDMTARKKNIEYWTRSVASQYAFLAIGSAGLDFHGSSGDYGIALGFCTN